MTIIRLDVLLYLCITLYCAVAVLCCMLQNVLLIHCGVVCYDDQWLVKSLACDRELADGPREEWSESVIENYIISAVHNCTISRVSGGRGLLHAHCFNKGSVYGYDYFGYNIIERERELGLLLFFSNMGSTIYKKKHPTI